MNCPSCDEPMRLAMFMHCHICENCDIDIDFTPQERQSAEIWRFKRAERITKQVRKDLIDGKIGWKKKDGV
jgi:hypothetical protein